MKHTHLVHKRSGSSILFHFRSKIPKDLVSHFEGKRQSQISLKNVNSNETLFVSLTLKNLVQELFTDIRKGFSYRKISDMLRVEYGLIVSFMSVREIIKDIEWMRKEKRNLKRRKFFFKTV